MQCVYLNAQRGQESLLISLRVLQKTVMIVHFPCSLGVHLLLFCQAFSLVVFRLSYVLCIYCIGILIWQINCFIINLCFVDICFKSFCFVWYFRHHCWMCKS